MSDEWAMVLNCTNRGRHDPVVVWEVAFHGALGDITPDALTVATPNSMLELDCTECPRTPRLRHADVRKLAVVVVEQFRAGNRRVEFDISKLGR